MNKPTASTTQEPITLSLHPDQYKCLIDMTYIAYWVIASHTALDEPEHEPYRELEKLVYENAQKAGYGEYFRKHEGDDAIYPTREYEDSGPAKELIEQYDDQSFWDALIDRLAWRDAEREVGGAEALVRLAPEKRLMIYGRHADKFRMRFEEQGLDAIQVRR